MFDYNEKYLTSEEREVLMVMRRSYYEIKPNRLTPYLGISIVGALLICYELFASVGSPRTDPSVSSLVVFMLSMMCLLSALVGNAAYHEERLGSPLSDSQLSALRDAGLVQARVFPQVQSALANNGYLTLRALKTQFDGLLLQLEKEATREKSLDASPVARDLLSNTLPSP